MRRTAISVTDERERRKPSARSGTFPGGRRRLLALLALALVLALIAGLAAVRLPGGNGIARTPDRALALFTSLPIFWNESEGVADLVASKAPPHWALEVLRRHGRLLPLDMLAPGSAQAGTNSSTTDPLAGVNLLVMAQPRPLSPDENVALDAWVRGGGRLLLFADPLLTADSVFPLGDRRRPQDIVLLSPILARWGLTLVYDEGQPAGERTVQVLGGPIPVNQSGRFVVSGKDGDCVPLDGGRAALCRIGAGRVLALADAAMLESGASGDPALRPQALERALSHLESSD